MSNGKPDEIRVLLTDLDGVVRHWDAAVAAEIETEHDLPTGSFLATTFAEEDITLAITGQITDEEWRQRIVDALQSRFPHVAADELVRRWSTPSGTVDRDVVAMLRACRQRVPVIAVTNGTTRLRTDLDRLGIADEFDHVVNSAEVGHAKPDPGIFLAALRLVGVAPSEALFTDDTPGHVESARRLGIHAHHYRSVANLRALLNRHGLIDEALSR